jgi:hypothetical protein
MQDYREQIRVQAVLAQFRKLRIQNRQNRQYRNIGETPLYESGAAFMTIGNDGYGKRAFFALLVPAA